MTARRSRRSSHAHSFQASIDPHLEFCRCGEVRDACFHTWQTVNTIWAWDVDYDEGWAYTQRCTKCKHRRMIPVPEELLL